ncbi:response regulator transcription factor (plasmid) [Rhodococcoides fascians A21d2]|uniref:response regulator transcription factor n=1 Tax=Rhodococcoides fascians TaxID=1828 RepID=UPI00068E74E3|nr:response regulator transcription factor [Rhodococcus fascians]QII03696.1 response regulator transcription factor [Rhodococcus fascians A21d2]
MASKLDTERSIRIRTRQFPVAPIRHLTVLSVDPIAVVDDNCILRRRGHTVNLVGSGKAALQHFRTSDVVLLNMDLPDLDAFDVCSIIRRESDVPIIAIVNTDDELDRVLALRAGADDCVMKSCGFHEVVARIDAVIGRSRPPKAKASLREEMTEFGGLTLDASTRRSRVDNKWISLTEKEFDLLAFLVRKHPAPASREDIMKSVWDTDWTGSNRTIDTHVSSLRAKLGSVHWIQAVRGVGYRMTLPPAKSDRSVCYVDQSQLPA